MVLYIVLCITRCISAFGSNYPVPVDGSVNVGLVAGSVNVVLVDGSVNVVSLDR